MTLLDRYSDYKSTFDHCVTREEGVRRVIEKVVHDGELSSEGKIYAIDFILQRWEELMQ